VLALLACSSYSYSEEIFGSTQNAASNGFNWAMTNILPQQTGLEVNGMVYRYTTTKDPSDDMLVHIQNEDAINGGFVFRNTDDWSGVPGNTINKVVPIANIPIQFWGDGSIEVEGEGEVSGASVIYTYQFDPCFDPQSSPTCPGYKDPFDIPGFDINVKDPLDDDLIQAELDRKANLKDEDEEDRQRQRVVAKEKLDARLESLMGIVNTSLLAADAAAKHAELMAMNYIPQSYYASIPGGTYVETTQLKDKELPDNPKARRVSFAQQVLHEEMVNSQYNKN